MSDAESSTEVEGSYGQQARPVSEGATPKLEPERIRPWEERDVLGIEKCRSCSLQLACGGGCGAVAKNRMGSVTAPDCRPVRELIGLGVALYAPT